MTADRRLGWRSALLTAGGVLVLGGATGGLALTLAGRPAAAAGSGTRLATAPVVRTGLVNTVQVSGSLGYAGSVTVVNQTAGTAYTALPQPGQVVRRGGRLYEVDGSPVFLFYGGRPEWRALAVGVTPGPDVAQLDRNLIALGYATAATLTVSDTYTGATALRGGALAGSAAGLPVTGTVPLGQVVFAPGALRVNAVSAGLGVPAAPGGTVLTATSDRPVVTAQLPVSQEYLVRRGDRVTVTLPNGSYHDAGGGHLGVHGGLRRRRGGERVAGAVRRPVGQRCRIPRRGRVRQLGHGAGHGSAGPPAAGRAPVPGPGHRQHRQRPGQATCSPCR